MKPDFLAAAFCLFSFSPALLAADYYISLKGDDSNEGTSPESPFATIQKAVDQMGAGDTCFIKGGHYQQVINLGGRAGSKNKPLTLKSYKGEAIWHQHPNGVLSYDNKHPKRTYSLGINLTPQGEDLRGLSFNNGTSSNTLDESGTKAEFGTNMLFQANESNIVVIDIKKDGAWSYSINGTTEASGTIKGGFDLTKSYHVAAYARDEKGKGKAIQHLSIEKL